MKRLLIVISVILMLALVLGACSAAQPAAPAAEEPTRRRPSLRLNQPRNRQTNRSRKPEALPLRVALTTFPNALDIPAAAEKNASNASWSLYDSLVWVDHDGKVYRHWPKAGKFRKMAQRSP